MMEPSPPVPAYNRRNFQEDLDWFKAYVVEQRLLGKKVYGDAGGLVPYFPHSGLMHRMIDGEEGCPNFSTIEETRVHVRARSAWVDALLEALTKEFL